MAEFRKMFYAFAVVALLGQVSAAPLPGSEPPWVSLVAYESPSAPPASKFFPGGKIYFGENTAFELSDAWLFPSRPVDQISLAVLAKEPGDADFGTRLSITFFTESEVRWSSTTRTGSGFGGAGSTGQWSSGGLFGSSSNTNREIQRLIRAAQVAAAQAHAERVVARGGPTRFTNHDPPDTDHYYSVAISWPSSAVTQVRRLCQDLREKGVRVWVSLDGIPAGASLRSFIDEQIWAHDKLLVVLTADSIASQWVESEVESALEHERQQRLGKLVPVRLDDAVLSAKTGWPAYVRRTREIVDLTEWNDEARYQEALAKLLTTLRRAAVA